VLARGLLGERPRGETVPRRGRLVGRPPLSLGLESGASWRRQWYRESLAGQTEPLRNRTVVSLFAEATCIWPGPRLTIVPAWRWQRAVDDFPALPVLPWMEEEPLAEPHVVDAAAPSLSLVWDALPRRLALQAHAARMRRLPTWVELFGHRGGIAGNRELTPETITSADLAASWRLPVARLRLRAALFWNQTTQAILFQQVGPRTSRAANFGATRARGLELEMAHETAGGLSAAGSLTWQDARDRGDDPAYRGKRLPFLPQVEAHLRLEDTAGGWRPRLELSLLGDNYRDRYNVERERAPARTVIDVGLARVWRLGDRSVLTLTAEVVNLTDDDVYDVEGYPLPGRCYRLSLHVR
jgi:outer membrane receptor protein involved in Fe transport